MSSPSFFVGLPFTSAALEAALDASPPPRGFRRFAPVDRHFTLAFLGPCARAEADAAWAVVERLLLPTRQVDGSVPSKRSITLGAVVPMGNPRRYSALSALVAEGREPLEAWMEETRGPLLAAAGRAPETRAAKAHLTLARPQRRATEHERREGLVWARELDLRGVSGPLERIALYTWSSDRTKQLFEIVAELPLPLDVPT